MLNQMGDIDLKTRVQGQSTSHPALTQLCSPTQTTHQNLNSKLIFFFYSCNQRNETITIK